jgi:hypothetical protein
VKRTELTFLFVANTRIQAKPFHQKATVLALFFFCCGFFLSEQRRATRKKMSHTQTTKKKSCPSVVQPEAQARARVRQPHECKRD